jgi:transcriptional regulator with XRE-family HTH domain
MDRTETTAGATVREIREALGMSQDELASLAGVGQGYLSRFERGECEPSPRWLRDVKEALASAMAGEGAA